MLIRGDLVALVAFGFCLAITLKFF